MVVKELYFSLITIALVFPKTAIISGPNLEVRSSNIRILKIRTKLTHVGHNSFRVESNKVKMELIELKFYRNWESKILHPSY